MLFMNVMCLCMYDMFCKYVALCMNVRLYMYVCYVWMYDMLGYVMCVWVFCVNVCYVCVKFVKGHAKLGLPDGWGHPSLQLAFWCNLGLH